MPSETPVPEDSAEMKPQSIDRRRFLLAGTAIAAGTAPSQPPASCAGTRNTDRSKRCKRSAFTGAERHTVEGMTVVMSLTDLVDIVQVAAKGQSFGEALDAAGFRPVSGKKIGVREGAPSATAYEEEIQGTGQ